MFEDHLSSAPAALAAILAGTERIGFSMASDALTGALLRTLAASKPGGKMLELGTGTGLGTAWLLDGMDQDSRLISIDSDAVAMQVAREQLGLDPRLELRLGDAGPLLAALPAASFDLIFADTWPGKYTHLDEALGLLKVGGLYLVDDMLPQPGWPDDHPPKVERLIAELRRRAELTLTSLRWSSGLIIAAKSR